MVTNLKDYVYEPVVEDMEPGVVYQINNPAVRKLEKKMKKYKRYYMKWKLAAITLAIFSLCVMFFSIFKFAQLNASFEELSEKYDIMNERFDTTSAAAGTTSMMLTNLKNAAVLSQMTEPNSVEILEKEEVVEETTPTPESTTVVPEASATIPAMYDYIPLDNNLKSYIIEKATAAGIPSEVMFAMAWKESSFNPNAKSGTNDHGLFQINAINFARLAEHFGLSDIYTQIYDPYINTDCAIYILSECKNNYHNDNWHHVLMRYNQGPGGAQDSFNSGVYSSNYSRAALQYAAENFGFSAEF